MKHPIQKYSLQCDVLTENDADVWHKALDCAQEDVKTPFILDAQNGFNQ